MSHLCPTQSALPHYHPSQEKYNKDIIWSLNQTVNDGKTFNQNLVVCMFILFSQKEMGTHKSKVDRYQCILYCVHVSSINSFFVTSRQGIIFWFVADLIQWGRKCQERNPILMRCLLFSPPLAHLWCNEVIIMPPPCFPMFCVLPRKSALPLQQQTSYDDGSDASLILLLPFFCNNWCHCFQTIIPFQNIIRNTSKKTICIISPFCVKLG